MESIDDKDLTILNLIKSNRRLKAAVGVLVFFILISFTYAFVQQGIAEEMRRFAVDQEQKAIKAAEEALKQRKMAEMSALEAMKQNLRAEAALGKIPKK